MQFLVCGLHIVALEDHVGEGADTVFLSGRREQHQMGLRTGGGHFYPAGLRAHGFVAELLEAKVPT